MPTHFHRYITLSERLSDFSLQCSDTLGWMTGRTKLGVSLLVMTFWLELCTSYSSNCQQSSNCHHCNVHYKDVVKHSIDVKTFLRFFLFLIKTRFYFCNVFISYDTTTKWIQSILLCPRPHRAEALSDDARLMPVWRLSRTRSLSREQRGLERPKLAQR